MLNTNKHQRRLTSSRHKQRGVGLIEVLIAVLVLAIGMLGMAGLQAWSLRNNQSAMERGMAVVQAYSIADIMRADRITAQNGGFNIGPDDAAPSGSDYASQAIADWRDALRTALGAGTDPTGGIRCNGRRCDILVRWSDARGTRNAGDEESQQELLIEVEL